MASDAVVERLAEVLDLTRLNPFLCNTPTPEHRAKMAGEVLDALPDLLREDSAAGEALRERLGLKVEHRQSESSWAAMTTDSTGKTTSKGVAATESRLVSSWRHAGRWSW